MSYRSDQPDGLTFLIKSADDLMKKVSWERMQYHRIQSSVPQDWQGMVYSFINACITLTSLVDWYAKALTVDERALSRTAEDAVDGFAICKAIANTTKHGSYRSPKNPLAAVGLGRTMTELERTMTIEEQIAYSDETVFHDWKVSVQTGKGQFYGDEFLSHVASGLVAFGRDKGVTVEDHFSH